MRVPRVFGSALPAAPGAPYVLDGPEAVHLTRVLRIRPGDRFEAFDGAGGAGVFRVTGVERRGGVEAVLEARVARDRELGLAVTVAAAAPKGKRAQRLVEALVELGAAELLFWRPARAAATAPREDDIRRWALEAAKQCGRNRLPAVGPPLDLAGLAEGARACVAAGGLALVLDTRAARPLRELLAGARPGRALVVVGPEGGLTPDEVAALRAAGAAPVGLGPAVLRIETAAAAALAGLALAWGDPRPALDAGEVAPPEAED